MANAALAAHIRGLKEAKAAFQQLPVVVRERMLAATETTVREIARNAQARLRSSPSIRTRALHDHIAWRVTKTNGRGRVGVSAGSTVVNGVKVKGIITPGAGGSAAKSAGAKSVMPSRYAHLVEFGSRHMGAEPFMLPSAESQRQPYLERCRAAGRDVEKDLSVGRTL